MVENPTQNGALTTRDKLVTLDWTQAYLNFILEAEVPQRGEGKDGSYDLNKYSEPAMKVFRKMIEKEGIIYGILVKSTMLYYKTHKRYAVTIGNYIEKGNWRSDYNALQSAAETGNIAEHIQTEISNDEEFSRFKLG